MIARISKALNEKEKGFTLVELLVVIVIIGILSAIAIPQFLKYREGAWDKSVESDIAQTRTAVEGFSINNSGKFPEDFTLTDGVYAGTQEIDFKGSADNTITYTLGADNTYEITGVNANNTGKTYTYKSVDGKGEWSE